MTAGAGRGTGQRGGEKQRAPAAESPSGYGRPMVSATACNPDIPGYLFLGGLAGASSTLAAGAQLTGRDELGRALKSGAAAAIGLSAAALVHDLGRRHRLASMTSVLRLMSPMRIGTWIVPGYVPLALAAAVSAVTRKRPGAGLAATIGAAVLGPGVASYPAVLLGHTATPAWHEARRELPFVFAGSAATAAGGLGMLAVRPGRAGQAVRFAVLGAAGEVAAKSLLLQRLGPAADPYQTGRAGRLLDIGEVLTAAGLSVATLAGRSRVGAPLAGLALMTASALTRFGIFEAGLASARDLGHTAGPQREHRQDRSDSGGQPGTVTTES